MYFILRKVKYYVVGWSEVILLSDFGDAIRGSYCGEPSLTKIILMAASISGKSKNKYYPLCSWINKSSNSSAIL